jgi:acyl-CoA thioesterase-1
MSPFPSRFASALAEGRPQTLVASGDSLTFGYLVRSGYLARVEQGLRARFPAAGLTVRNEGVCGATAPDGLRRFDHDVAPARADLLLIQYGLNDAFEGLPLAAFTTALERLVERQRALRPDGEILLVPPPLLPVPAEERVARPFRDALHEAGERLGTLVAPIAARWPAAAPHLFLSDRVHPTDEGHQQMADAVLEALVG